MRDYFTPGGEDYNASQNFHAFTPGSSHAYANMNAALIGYLVETISGQPFDAYCRAELFGPLGMTRSYWRLSQAVAPHVSLYEYEGGDDTLLAPYTFTDYPNGGLWSTARDLQRLLASPSQAYRGTDETLLSEATARAMFSAQVPTLDATVGLHAFLLDADSGAWGHDGGESGTSTIIGVNPSTGRGAIVLANQSDAALETIFEQVMRE